MSVLNKFLKVLLKPSKQSTKHDKSTGHVLTSAKRIRIMEEKEKKELKAIKAAADSTLRNRGRTMRKQVDVC